MVNGFNFKSLIQSINTELNELKATAAPLQIEAIVNDQYNKLYGIKGYEFNKLISPQSLSFYDDTQSHGIWKFSLDNLDATTYTFLSIDNFGAMYNGEVSAVSIVDSLTSIETIYPMSFVTSETAVYFLVLNSGMIDDQYINWIDDAATLSGITDYFSSHQIKIWYHVKDSSTLTVNIPNVITQNLTANTFHANTTNDLAEYRISVDHINPGYVVENNEETITLCKHDASKMAIGIVSNTSGLTIGDKNNSYPIAISGRVLAYYEGELEPGDLVCSTENGKVRKMTDQEKMYHPEIILGKVLYIPKEKEWNGILINNRVWIQVK